jgi:hypothetical protein
VGWSESYLDKEVVVDLAWSPAAVTPADLEPVRADNAEPADEASAEKD